MAASSYPTLIVLTGLLLKPRPGPWTRTMKNLDPVKCEPRKTWTLRNLDPEKHGINVGLKNMSDLQELFYKDHAECDFLFKSLYTKR